MIDFFRRIFSRKTSPHRSGNLTMMERRELEKDLRASGLSRRESVVAISIVCAFLATRQLKIKR